MFTPTPMHFFFFNDTATTEIYTLSLHDALPISNTVWTPVPGLPRVVVLSLNARGRSRIVRASTSGRGTWILQDNNVAIPAGPFLSSIRPTSAPADSTAVTLRSEEHTSELQSRLH